MGLVDKEKKKAYDLAWKRANKERLNAALRAKRAANREAHNTKAREYQQKNKVHRERLRVHKVYGVSPDEYEQMYQEQKGLCGICKNRFDTLCVDHCHTTKIVRGLLCRSCNFGLGHFKDSLQSLRNAVAYLGK